MTTSANHDASEPFSPSTCPLGVQVSIVRVVDPVTGQRQELEIDERNARGQAILFSIVMGAIERPELLEQIGGLPRRAWRHPSDCPLCALHARPGPRVWGRWVSDAWRGDPVYASGPARRPHPDVELFGNDAHAREEAARMRARFVDNLSRRGYTLSLEAGAMRAYLSGPCFSTRSISENSQLWLWDTPPTRYWPDRVLCLGTDGVSEMTGRQLAHRHRTGRIPSGVLGNAVPSPPPSPVRVGAMIIEATGTGDHIRLRSILDTTSPAAPRRILSDGTVEALPDAPAGLTLYGRWQSERPPLSRLGELTPEYAGLVPAIVDAVAARG